MEISLYDEKYSFFQVQNMTDMEQLLTEVMKISEIKVG